MKEETPTLIKLLNRTRKSGKEINSDAILMMFLKYVDALKFKLYETQEEAILEILAKNHVIISTPTGSGKSMVALALHFKAMVEGKVSFYTAPTKALVNEKFFSLCETLGPQNVGLLTGDATVNKDACVICCTAEILSNMALRSDDVGVDYVVMDEFHFYADKERGTAWQIPLITMPDSVFLIMSATLGNMTEIKRRLCEFTKRDVAVIKGTVRPVPLEYQYLETHTHETIERLVAGCKTPAYLVNFTQRDCAEQALSLMSIKICSRKEKKQIAGQLSGVKFDTPYGKEFQRFVRHGIGIHHAGLLPKYKRIVEKLALLGLIKVISGTDTLGVGVNIPIKTVVIRQLYKYDGEKVGIIKARQFHQIAGRAGRKGFDDHGLVVVQAPWWEVENKKIEIKLLKNPHLIKKLRKKKAPPRSIPWNKSTLSQLKNAQPEALVPRFTITHGMIMNFLQNKSNQTGSGYKKFVNLIALTHGNENQKKLMLKRATQLFRALRNAGIVSLVKSENGKGCNIAVEDNLQKDFSLNHTLSLYLVQTISLLEEPDTLALDMLTLVEAILEDPKIVLYKQTDRLKEELMAKLKAEGVEYHERIERLKKVKHPRVNEEFIVESFAAFSSIHPWVDDENIHPKNVARQMYENGCNFYDYVYHYGLARSEGVLLRYLTEVYKAAVQNVPETDWTDEFRDILKYLHELISQIDSSLLEEWSLMMKVNHGFY